VAVACGQLERTTQEHLFAGVLAYSKARQRQNKEVQFNSRHDTTRQCEAMRCEAMRGVRAGAGAGQLTGSHALGLSVDVGIRDKLGCELAILCNPAHKYANAML
jgi:hypothetical protein